MVCVSECVVGSTKVVLCWSNHPPSRCERELLLFCLGFPGSCNPFRRQNGAVSVNGIVELSLRDSSATARATAGVCWVLFRFWDFFFLL